jgi:3-hydroxyisobutyrate dehydrogenase-like beta-hydroxyacid dehydrogenase
VTGKVAVIGLGRMGAAMARRIHGAGAELILWNRDQKKSEAISKETGAAVAKTAAEAAARSDFVLTSLADGSAVGSVYLGPDGIVEGIGAGSIAIDTSTIDRDTTIRVGEAVDATGGGFVDCPVSGSVATVEAGTLTVMAGGEDVLIKQAGPVLAAISSRVIHVGPRGAGSACKLAVNGLVHGLNIALSEALVLAEKAGVERETAYEVFVSGAGGAPFVKYKRAAYENPDTTPVAFSLDLVAKDLELITELGRRVNAPMQQAQVGLEIVRRAIGAGMGESDLSAIAVFLRGDDT